VGTYGTSFSSSSAEVGGATLVSGTWAVPTTGARQRSRRERRRARRAIPGAVGAGRKRVEHGVPRGAGAAVSDPTFFRRRSLDPFQGATDCDETSEKRRLGEMLGSSSVSWAAERAK
jgi:hypothetical protein